MKTPDLARLGSRRAVWADFDPIFGFAARDQVILGDLIRRFANSPVAMQQGWRLMDGIEYRRLHDRQNQLTLRRRLGL